MDWHPLKKQGALAEDLSRRRIREPNGLFPVPGQVDLLGLNILRQAQGHRLTRPIAHLNDVSDAQALAGLCDIQQPSIPSPKSQPGVLDPVICGDEDHFVLAIAIQVRDSRPFYGQA